MNKTTTSFTEKHWRILLAAIIAAAAALRAVGLSRNVFFIDEAFSYVLASQGLRGILRGAMSESNPPLPMLLFHVWQMFGRSEVFLRVLPTIFNVLTVPVVFALGRRIRGTNAGLASAALFALSAGMLDISLIYRYPALLTLLGGLFVLLYFRAAAEPVFSFGSLAVLAVVEIAGLYTHYFFIFPVLGVNLIVLWDAAISRAVPPKRFMAWLASQVVAAAAFVPWLVAFRRQASKELVLVPLHQSLAHLAHSMFGAIPKVMYAYLFGPHILHHRQLLVAVTSLLILIIFAYYVIRKEPRVLKLRLLAIFAVIMIAPYLMMLFLGLRLMPLYYCVAAPVFFVVVGVGVCSFKDKFDAPIVFTALLIACLTSSITYHFMPKYIDNKMAIQEIAIGWREGDVVVVNPTYQASLFEYFAPGKFRLFGIPKNFDIDKYNYNDTTQVTEARLRELDGIVGKDGRVWAFMGFGTKTKPDQNELTISYLTEHYKLAGEAEFVPISFSEPVGRLYLFEKKEKRMTNIEH